MELFSWFSRWFSREKRVRGCRACGECCKAFGATLHASKADIERWKQLGRDDLLERVTELGWLWVDPETGKRGAQCPYLKQIDEDRLVCGIHEIKPDICRAYPTMHHWKQCIRGISFD